MASIKDVAKLAGVSVMTASRAINGRDSVSPEATAKVATAAKALEYRPNLTARSLRSRRSLLLGLLVPDIENPVFASFAKHVEEEAQRRGYNVMLGNTWEDAGREARYLELMLARQMDGIIVSPVSGENARLAAECRLPVVVVDRVRGGGADAPSVTVDNLAVGGIAARHLLELGHRHFACIPGPLRIEVFARRLEGFREELARRGMGLDMVLGVEATGKPGFGARAGGELLRLCRARPLALFCANDVTALGAMRAAQRLGLSVPGDVSIVGVDGIPAGELALPRLTTVRQPLPEMAAAAVSLLVDMLEKGRETAESVVLRPELAIRESTSRRR